MSGVTAGLLLVIVGYLLWMSMFLEWQHGIRVGTVRPRVPWKLFKWEDREKGVPGPLDYWTNGFGDLFALPILDFMIGGMYWETGTSKFMILFPVIGILAAYLFYRVAVKWQRATKDIDWWFRFDRERVGPMRFFLGRARVRMNSAGGLHLVYYAFQATIISIGAWLIFFHEERSMSSEVIPLAILFGVYVYYSAMDRIQGHFK